MIQERLAGQELSKADLEPEKTNLEFDEGRIAPVNLPAIHAAMAIFQSKIE